MGGVLSAGLVDPHRPTHARAAPMTPSPYRTVIEAMFRIVDKSGVTVDFALNSIQAVLDADWSRRNIVPKARQEGVSSYVVARYVAKCLSEQNRTCVIIS